MKSLTWSSHRAFHRMLVRLAIIVGVLGSSAVAAHAVEIIPSVGVSKTVHDDDAQARMQFGLAARGNWGSIMKPEIGIAYREEERSDDQLSMRSWPVTASLWLAPGRGVVYAGGGVGWYHTTFDYDDALNIESSTSQQFGVHLGGGLGIPLANRLTLDLNGRYVFLKDETSELPPEEFNPSYWTTSLGLALGF